MLLQRHAGGEPHRHDGQIAVAERNRRWCSDGFQIGCDNGEQVRVAFTLDCCDREAISFVPTTGGIGGLEPRTTPQESPRSNGMAEAFVGTFKRDYARVNAVPDATTVFNSLLFWFDQYNRIHPHKALGYRSPNRVHQRLYCTLILAGISEATTRDWL